MDTTFTHHEITGVCQGGGYKYAHTFPLHPRANSKGLYPYHRVLVENYLGRYLEYNETVHHKDGNKQHDDLDNLEVLTRSEHAKLHRVPAPTTDCDCLNCHKRMHLTSREWRLRTRRNNNSHIFCSISCGTKYYFKEKRLAG
jgi:hypothetical protein